MIDGAGDHRGKGPVAGAAGRLQGTPTQLVGRKILYWWPGEGWQLGSVARVSAKAGFSHVVAYNKTSPAIRGTADSLLDSVHYGARWVLSSPLATPAVRPGRAALGCRVRFSRSCLSGGWGFVFLFFPFSFLSGGRGLVWSVGRDSQALGRAGRRSCRELGRPGCLTTW